MPATLLAHIHNEELLLPYWLRHHRELFDHGVIVDRGSTDRSVEIVRELTPGWEVVPSRNPLFDARDTDLEMMAHERRHRGWKIVLNATEFLLHDDLRGHLEEVERASPPVRGLGIRVLSMIDAPAERGRPLDDRPLFLQRHHHLPGGGMHPRYLHRERDGRYGSGRHSVPFPHVADDELVILKYRLSPWPEVRGRTLQMAGAMTDADIRLGMGWAVFATEEELAETIAAASPSAVDIAADPRIAATLRRLRQGYRRRDATADTRTTPDPARRVAVVAADPSETRPAGLVAALAERHEVRAVRADASDAREQLGWADVVIADVPARRANPAILEAPQGMVFDLAGGEPAADADEVLLLRADFFLWPPGDERAWLERFAAEGRIADPGAPEVVLLGTAVGPETTAAEIAARLEAFIVTPRRTTARRARDTILPVSRIAHFRRQKAAVEAIHVAASRVIELEGENARLRSEIAALREERARAEAAPRRFRRLRR